jgi:phosphatidylserine/phosphatidylglycerophosphate/cardiolipin synthase-like enzyme
MRMSATGTPARRAALTVGAVIVVAILGTAAPVLASGSSGGGTPSSKTTTAPTTAPTATPTTAPTATPTSTPTSTPTTTPSPEPPTPSMPPTDGPYTTGVPDDYLPPAGAKFNYPVGTRAQQRILFTHIIRSINSAAPGSTIRIAVFSFQDNRTAKDLIAAYQRGVNVKLVFDGTNIYPSMAQVRAAIGSDISAKSFVVFCHHSCRGTTGQMHAKYFSFNRVGSEKDITMVGSNNLTDHNSTQQWSDLYTVINDRAYFLLYRHWFTQLKYDTPVANPYESKTSGTDVVDIAPLNLSQEPDPILTALQPVTCEVTEGQIDPTSPTPDAIVHSKIWIAAHAWNGNRGKAIAQAVAALQRSGCRAKVFYGIGMGGAVMAILRGSGVALNPGTHNHVRTHEKMMVFQGVYGGVPATNLVWTGSHNWSDRALGRDDLIVRIADPVVTAQYIAQFHWMWKHG